MMTRRTDAEENSAELNELQSTIERLSGQVRCLTMAVDELTTESHWRNNQLAVALDECCPVCHAERAIAETADDEEVVQSNHADESTVSLSRSGQSQQQLFAAGVDHDT
jgi:hypothetical protein